MWREILASSVIGSLLLSAPALAGKPGRRTPHRAVASAEASAAVEPTESDLKGGRSVRRDPEILNATEMLSLVKKYAADIAEALVDGERQRELAIQKKDSIKLSCIQDRLANMKGMKKLADDRFAATQRPEIRADELNLRHEFRGVEMAHERVIELHKELLECVGQSLEISVTATSIEPSGATAPGGSTNPGGTNAEIPPADRPPAASTYQ